MATNQLRGDAVDVAQIATHSVAGTAATSQVSTLTCNGKSVAYTAILGDTNTTIAGVEVTHTGVANETPLGVATAFMNAFNDPRWTIQLGSAAPGNVPPPTLRTPVAVNGGLLRRITHYFVMTAVTADGETTKSNEVSIAIASNADGNYAINLSWSRVPKATGYNVYHGIAAGVYTDRLTSTRLNPAAWNATTPYVAGDDVSYNGRFYVRRVPNTFRPPGALLHFVQALVV